MADASDLRVSVVYAEPGSVFCVNMTLPTGATVADAIARSGIRGERPDIAIDTARLGVFARKATLATILRDGDRVEIYRPLLIDPKDARRKRARESGC